MNSFLDTVNTRLNMHSIMTFLVKCFRFRYSKIFTIFVNMKIDKWTFRYSSYQRYLTRVEVPDDSEISSNSLKLPETVTQRRKLPTL